MILFEYNWLHIPTGKTGQYSIQLNSQGEFLEKLNQWNASNPGVWHYYATATQVLGIYINKRNEV